MVLVLGCLFCFFPPQILRWFPWPWPRTRLWIMIALTVPQAGHSAQLALCPQLVPGAPSEMPLVAHKVFSWLWFWESRTSFPDLSQLTWKNREKQKLRVEGDSKTSLVSAHSWSFGFWQMERPEPGVTLWNSGSSGFADSFLYRLSRSLPLGRNAAILEEIGRFCVAFWQGCSELCFPH